MTSEQNHLMNTLKILETAMKKIVLGSLVILFVLTGCNTVAGVGKDVSKVGDVVTNSADKTADKL